MTPPTLYLVTGSRGAGKTTFCRLLAESLRKSGWRVDGFLSHPIFTGSLRTAIEALLAGRPIRPAETKAFGCAIARR